VLFSTVFVKLSVVLGEGFVTGIAVCVVPILGMGAIPWGVSGAPVSCVDVLRLDWECATKLGIVCGSSGVM
jgi:hypothetical protein